MIPDELIQSVKLHEGYRSRPYKCSAGALTIGYGTNLEELEVDEDTAEAWMVRDLEEAHDVLSQYAAFSRLDEVRQCVLVEMAYNLGISGLKGFARMWAAIDRKDFVEAAKEGMDSLWAAQVGRRAEILMERLETGEW